MKKDGDVLVFSILYVLIFTFTYIFIYYHIDAFLFILIIICGYSLPSLFAVLILLFIERQFKLNIHKIFYLFYRQIQYSNICNNQNCILYDKTFENIEPYNAWIKSNSNLYNLLSALINKFN